MNQHRRTKQNGGDFGVVIGGQQQQNPPPLARPGSNARSSVGITNNNTNKQQPQPDLTSAIESALRNGNLHVPNRNLIALPWLKMFPKTEEEIERELKEEEEKRKQRMMVGDGRPHPHNTFPRFGRRRVDHSIDLDMSSEKNQLKWWEGHPIVQLDCSSNNLESLVDDFDDIEKKHDDRFTRLADNLKLLQCSRNSIVSLPSFQGFSLLASLDISKNQLSGDLVFTLIFGSEHRDGDLSHFQSPLLPSLVELNASQNNFVSANGIIDLLAPDLRVLRLNNNKLQHFSLIHPSKAPTLSSMNDIKISSLREVDLSHNKLSVAPFLSPMIVGVNQHQQVQQTPDILFVSHPCLEMLELSFNPDFANVNPELVIGKNFMTTISPPPQFSQHMMKLRSLSLRHSGLSALGVNSCPELREINVSENRLTSFPIIDVASRAQLSSIDLSGNKLVSLDALVSIPQTGDQAIGPNNVAALFPQLERLDVTNNDLNSIPPRVCLLPKLRNMTLNGNPIRTIRRDLLAKNTIELKAYLRSRLDERENDESNYASAKVLHVQEAMEKTLMSNSTTTTSSNLDTTNQQQQQQPSAHGFHNNNNAQQQVVPPPVINKNQQNSTSAAVTLQPIGFRQGNLWDLSRKPASHHQTGGRVGSFSMNRNNNMMNSSSNSDPNTNIPLLPETIVAACILDVSPHTQEHVSECTKLSLAGQSRLRQISVDFFAELVPELTELDVSRTNLTSMKEILGDMTNGAPIQLKTVIASRCSLQGQWQIEWCRPLPGEQQALSHLDISCNTLTALPEEFGLAVCWSLRHLNLSHNRISQLPRALLHLRHLTELLFSSNGLVDSSLQQFGDLSQYWPGMNTLDLSFNELRNVHVLPNALGGFSPNTLRALKLEGNGIRFLSTHLIEGPSGALLTALKDRMVRN